MSWSGVVKYTLSPSAYVIQSFFYADKNGGVDIVIVKVNEP